jgi:hypothetical protein
MFRWYSTQWYATSFLGVPSVTEYVKKDQQSGGKTGLVSVSPSSWPLREINKLASKNDVIPEPTIGFWYTRDNSQASKGIRISKDDLVMYYLHGGGYVVSSLHYVQLCGHDKGVR